MALSAKGVARNEQTQTEGSKMSPLGRAVRLIVVALLVTQSSSAVAAVPSAWKPPANVRVVQHDGADNIRIFSTLSAAVASITDASATNPYLIKVMPGFFGVETVPSYITIEGSGPESTTVGVTWLEGGTIKNVRLYAGVHLRQGATIDNVVITAGTLD
jgi:pectin methylesterase-like acyl-CoA thioesterase